MPKLLADSYDTAYAAAEWQPRQGQRSLAARPQPLSVSCCEENPSDPQGKRYTGSADHEDGNGFVRPRACRKLARQADMTIPERSMAVIWALRRSADKGAYTIETTFNLPADFPGGAVAGSARSRVADEAIRAGARHPARRISRQGDERVFRYRTFRRRHQCAAQRATSRRALIVRYPDRLHQWQSRHLRHRKGPTW